MEKHLLCFMNSYSRGASGGDLCFIEIARRLSGFRLTVVTSRPGRRLCEERGLKADYIVTTREERFGSVLPTYCARIARAMAARLSSLEADALYVTSDFWPDVIPALVLKRGNGNPGWLQRIFHLIPRERVVPHLAQRLSLCIIRNRADIVVVDNTLLKEELVARGFPAGRVTVQPLGVDLERIGKIEEPAEKEYDGVFAGRFHRSKGILELIDTWRAVCERTPRARLAIAGNGNASLRSALEEKIRLHRLKKNVEVLGYLDHDGVLALMKRSKILVFPSHEEGFGMVIAEAMACGLPVVAWDLPSYGVNFPEAILTVPEGETASMAREVLKLLEDEESCRELRRRGYRVTGGLDWSVAAGREMELIRGCIGDR